MSRVLVAVKAAALVFVLMVGSMWVVFDREINLRIDGSLLRVHTRAHNVRGLLHVVGHEIRQRDKVSPALNAALRDGLTVRLNRARQLTVNLNGEHRRMWTTAHTVAGALADLKLGDQPLRLSTASSTQIPLDGMRLAVSTRKSVTLVVAKKPTTVSTFAATVDELLGEKDVSLDDDDRATPARHAPLRDRATVTVQRMTSRSAVEQVTLPIVEQRKEDGSLMQDQVKVEAQGNEGKAEEQVTYFEADGDIVERKVTNQRVLTQPQPKVTVQGTKAYPADDTGLNWAALAQCESTGNPRIVSASGMYHGLYQFSVQTWRTVGGIGLPSEATSREQTYRAILLYKRSGAGQWPECGSRLFS